MATRRASHTTSRRQSSSNLTLVGLQWGDEGKGKVVDYLSEGFQAVARYNGGSNAGHTVVLGSERYRFHLVPSGVLKRKKLLIGAGVALDPTVLSEELNLLSKKKIRTDLTIDGRCSLVSPLEKEMDGYLETLRGAGAIGTTRMGIGPAYAARALRMSPRALDLFSGSFSLSHMMKYYQSLLKKRSGLAHWLKTSKRLLKPLLGDVSSEVDAVNEKGGAVLFEGAHGSLLDLQFGTYPFVTSSSTIASYAPAGVGVPTGAGGGVLGVTKAYTTRVGAGPFPTELTGELGGRIREAGKEYGTTTGRPRRTGWLDLVALKYAVRISGARELALSKIDVLASVKDTKVCVAYSLGGSESSDFYKFLGGFKGIRPVYHDLPSLHGVGFRGGVPRAAKKLIDVIEAETRAHVRLLSYGEERSRTVEL